MTERTDAPHAHGEADLSYESYLKVPELLDLQVPQSDPPHHDEMLFIIIHQAYELWFKLILHEMDVAIQCMKRGSVLRARHFIHRIVAITKVLTDQIHILETMTPVEFLGFRDRLTPASGFQSVQFRQMEFTAGLKDERFLRFFANDPKAADRLRARLEGDDLRSAYYGMLRRHGFELPQDVSIEHLNDDDKDRQALFDALLPIYEEPGRDLPLYLLTEALVEFDESLALWREHHVRVVERVIGHKTGTGGSSGVDYLRTTTSKKCFPYLWEVRTYLGD